MSNNAVDVCTDHAEQTSIHHRDATCISVATHSLLLLLPLDLTSVKIKSVEVPDYTHTHTHAHTSLYKIVKSVVT